MGCELIVTGRGLGCVKPGYKIEAETVECRSTVVTSPAVQQKLVELLNGFRMSICCSMIVVELSGSAEIPTERRSAHQRWPTTSAFAIQRSE